MAGQVSDGCFQAALASFVFFSPERQTSALRIALAFAVILVPYSLLGPFAGVLLDRWSRQRVLVAANLGRAVLCLGVAGLVLGGRDDAAFLAVSLAVIGVNRFILSGLSAALPRVVPDGVLITANAVSTTIGTLSTVAGVGLGVVVRLLGGGSDTRVALVVTVAALGYALAGALAALGLDRAQLGPALDEATAAVRAAVTSVTRGFVEGLAHLRERPRAASAIAALGAFRFGWGIVTVGGVLLFRETYNAPDDPDAGLSALGTAFFFGGIGVFAAALVAPPLVRRWGTPPVISTALGSAAVGELVLGLQFTQATLFAVAFLATAAGQVVKISADTLVQQELEDVYRGRVFAVYDVVFNLTFVVGGLIAALVLPANGRSAGVVWIAVGCWLLGLGGYVWISRRTAQSRP